METIEWYVHTDNLTLFRWLQKYEKRIVTYSVTRYKLVNEELIAQKAIAILNKEL